MYVPVGNGLVVPYDTTLRDGAQSPGLTLTKDQKLYITRLLDELGIPYIEGGWPVSATGRDVDYFREVKELPLNSKVFAFGMTSKSRDVENDEYVKSLIEANPDGYTIVGKTDPRQVDTVLRIDRNEYLRIIKDTIDYLKSTGKPVFFDAEHFFDGYRYDQEYAMNALLAASAADSLVLCDTKGGSWYRQVLPGIAEMGIYEIVSEVHKEFDNELGIHCHDDKGLAVASTMEAIAAGAGQFQGTINALGERAGNANLCVLLPDLYLAGYETIGEEKMGKLTFIAHEIGRATGRRVPKNMAYVGSMAFAHAGGLHSDAMIKDTESYEHVSPDFVGNRRYFPLSRQSGRAVIRWWAKEYGFEVTPEDVEKVYSRMSETETPYGDAQIYLLLHRALRSKEELFRMDGVVIDILGRQLTGNEFPVSALVEVYFNDGHSINEKSVGKGPVNAIDLSMRKSVRTVYPSIDRLQLVDYHVELPSGEHGTAALVDAEITFAYNGQQFTSRAIDPDILKASFMALKDAYEYYIFHNANE